MSGKSQFFLFFAGHGSPGISFSAREFYDIAVKKSGKGQGIEGKKQCSQYCIKVGTHKNHPATYN